MRRLLTGLDRGQLERDVYLGRAKDIGIVASSPAPISAAKERLAKQFEDSMLVLFASL